MNNFWNEPVEEVMQTNGTVEALIQAQWDDFQTELVRLHEIGLCDGGEGDDSRLACPVCLGLRAAHKVREIRSDVDRRNARLK